MKIALGCIALCLWATGAQSAPLKHNLGIVSITFDDATSTQEAYGLPLIQKYHLPGTLYVNAGLVRLVDAPAVDGEAVRKFKETGTYYMDWNGVRKFRDAGWEIGAHTMTHPFLTKIPEAQLRDELTGPIGIIQLETGEPPVDFASPYGDTNSHVQNLIAGLYQSHVLAKAEGPNEINDFRTVDPFNIVRYVVNTTGTSETLCNMVKKAAATREWLVFAFHNIAPRGTEPGPYKVSEAALDQTFACVRTMQDEGKIRVATVRRALDMVLGAHWNN